MILDGLGPRNQTKNMGIGAMDQTRNDACRYVKRLKRHTNTIITCTIYIYIYTVYIAYLHYIYIYNIILHIVIVLLLFVMVLSWRT